MNEYQRRLGLLQTYGNDFKQKYGEDSFKKYSNYYQTKSAIADAGIDQEVVAPSYKNIDYMFDNRNELVQKYGTQGYNQLYQQAYEKAKPDIKRIESAVKIKKDAFSADTLNLAPQLRDSFVYTDDEEDLIRKSLGLAPKDFNQALAKKIVKQANEARGIETPEYGNKPVTEEELRQAINIVYGLNKSDLNTTPEQRETYRQANRIEKDYNAPMEYLDRNKEVIQEQEQKQDYYSQADPEIAKKNLDAITEGINKYQQEVYRLSGVDEQGNQFTPTKPNGEPYTEEERIQALQLATQQLDEAKAQRATQAQNVKGIDTTQMLNRHAVVMENPDFKEKSVQGASSKGDLTHELINGRDEATKGLQKTASVEFENSGVYKYLLMSDDEKQVYNYYYAESPEKANQFLKDMDDVLNQRAGSKTAEKIKGNFMAENRLAATAGFENALTNIGQLFSKEALPTTPTEYASAEVRANMGKDITFNGVVYDFLNNTMNMLPSIAVGTVSGGAGAVALGLTSGAGSYRQALQEGYTIEQARAYGLASGLKETLMSYALSGISQLGGKVTGNAISKITSGIKNPVVKGITTVLMRMGSEFGEEFTQEFLEPILRNFTLDENNKVEFANGEQFYAGLLGALTAGLFSAGNIKAETKESIINDIEQQTGLRADDLSPQTQTPSKLPPTRPNMTVEPSLPQDSTNALPQQETQEKANKSIAKFEDKTASERVFIKLEELGVDMSNEAREGATETPIINVMVDVSNFVRQGTVSDASAAKAISEQIDKIKNGEKVSTVKIVDRALELDGKQMPESYRRQYHRTQEEIAKDVEDDKRYQKGIDDYIKVKNKLDAKNQTQEKAIPSVPLANKNYDSISESIISQNKVRDLVKTLETQDTSPKFKMDLQMFSEKQNPTKADITQLLDRFVEEGGDIMNLQKRYGVRSAAVSMAQAAVGTEIGDKLYDDIENGVYNYVPESSKPDVEEAIKLVETMEQGELLNVQDILDRNGEVQRYGKKDVALVEALWLDALKRNDTKAADHYAAIAADMGTVAGQTVQTFANLTRLTPEGFLLFAERQLQRLNAEGAKKYGKKWNEVQFTPEEQRAILEAKDADARDVELDKAMTRIKRTLPMTKWEKFDSVHKVFMLSNPATLIRNFGGNAIMKGAEAISKKVESLIQLTLKKENRTVVFKLQDKYKNMVKGAWENGGKKLFQGTTKYEMSDSRGKQVFDDKGLGKIYNKYSELIGRNMEWGDVVFAKSAYETALARYLQAKGLDTITPEATAYAMKEALEVTYRDFSAFASAFDKFLRSKGGRAFTFVTPFVKTPTNIARRAFEFSEAGLLKTLVVDTIRLHNSVKKGNSKFTAQQYIKNLSRGITGTFGLSALGYMLGSGILPVLLTGDWSDKDKERELQQLQGFQPFSLKVGDTYISLAWAQPVMTPIMVGAQMAQAVKDNTNVLGAFDPFESAKLLLDGLGDLTVYSGLKNTFSNTKDMSDVLTKIVVSAANQMIPAVIRKVAQTLDKTKYDVYVGGAVERGISQAITSLPGAKDLLESIGVDPDIAPQVDPFGKVKTQSDSFIIRAALNFLSPTMVTTNPDDKVTKELQNLFNEWKADGNNPTEVLPPQREQLGSSKKKFSELEQVYGQAIYRIIGAYMNTSAYRSATLDAKVSNLKKIYAEQWKIYKKEFESKLPPVPKGK